MEWYIIELEEWADNNDCIESVIIVGSYARGTNKITSDLDVVIITTNKSEMVETQEFIKYFGDVEKKQTEYYGDCTSIRVWYKNGPEIEFGSVEPSWISLGLIVFQVWLDLTLPEYMGKITDIVQTSGSEMSEILLAGGKMLLLTLASVAVSIVIAGLASRIATNLSARLRTNLFRKVQSFTIQEINNFSIPSLITRTTNDITQVQMLVVMGLQILIKSPILAVWAIVKIVGKSWQWSFATGVAVAVLIIVSIVMIALAIPKFKELQQQTDDLSRVSRENLTGLRVVRAYNAEGYQEEKFEKTNDSFTKTNLFSYRLLAALMPSVELIMNGLTHYPYTESVLF